MRGLQALPLFCHIGFWEGPRGAAYHVFQHTNRRSQEGWCWDWERELLSQACAPLKSQLGPRGREIPHSSLHLFSLLARTMLIIVTLGVMSHPGQGLLTAFLDDHHILDLDPELVK